VQLPATIIASARVYSPILVHVSSINRYAHGGSPHTSVLVPYVYSCITYCIVGPHTQASKASVDCWVLLYLIPVKVTGFE